MSNTARVPPNSMEGEQAVLGGMLLERDAIVQAQDYVTAPDFYREAHRLIFAALCDIDRRGEPADLTSLGLELQRRGQLDQAGGRPYLASLLDCVPTAAHTDAYAKVVRARSLLRQEIAAHQQAIEDAYAACGAGDWHPDELETAEAAILSRSEGLSSLVGDSTRVEFCRLGDALDGELERLNALHAEGRRHEQKGITSGLASVDTYTSGWRPGQLVYVGGRPGMGKTALMMTGALAAARQGKTALMFSFEMSSEELSERWLQMGCLVNSMRLRTGSMDDRHWQRLTEGVSGMFDLPLYWWAGPALTPAQLLAKCRRFKARTKALDLVIVDYLQLMHLGRRSDGRTQEMDEISRSLKRMASELGVPVVVGCQLSREVEKRTPPRPKLSDLRESGSIEADANAVVLLYNPEYYTRQAERAADGASNAEDPDGMTSDEAEVIIAKQRNAPTGTVTAGFQRNFVRFVELTDEGMTP